MRSTTSSPMKASTSIKSTMPLSASAMLILAYSSGSAGFSPPSFAVRNVMRIGVSSPTAARSFRPQSTIESTSYASSRKSIRHSSTSTGSVFANCACSIIPAASEPHREVMIFGRPSPKTTPRAFTVFIPELLIS